MIDSKGSGESLKVEKNREDKSKNVKYEGPIIVYIRSWPLERNAFFTEIFYSLFAATIRVILAKPYEISI